MKPTETYHIIRAMKATGNRPGVIEQWKVKVAAWAQMNRTDPNAAAVNAWLPHWQVREIYGAWELAPLWPALAIATGYTDRWPAVVKSAKRLEHELRFYGLPHRCIRGLLYFPVQRLHVWMQLDDNAWEREIENAHL